MVFHIIYYICHADNLLNTYFMPRSFDRIVVHTIFGTKYRLPWIDEIVEPHIHRIMTAMLLERGCHVLEINGTTDHVHILHTLPRTQTIAQIVCDIKAATSQWIKGFDPNIYAGFSWQEGYGVFSVDYRETKGVAKYIRNQKKHHGRDDVRMTFRHEYELILKKYEFDIAGDDYQFPERPTDLRLPRIIQQRLSVRSREGPLR